ncbi:hypothetical protein SELMODRAFT_408223 [Selaginella moellendorffii]|uniref:Histone-lysine N-methyltransferase, H3 lysine-79 specific n=1 Tax=Selaginella moellendorffii TaxID=88036 RepID=D8R7L1_SELML|nr:hypothetical protein SELMODRAFT_408223 [Selaginella moellendorffii]
MKGTEKVILIQEQLSKNSKSDSIKMTHVHLAAPRKLWSWEWKVTKRTDGRNGQLLHPCRSSIMYLYIVHASHFANENNSILNTLEQLYSCAHLFDTLERYQLLILGNLVARAMGEGEIRACCRRLSIHSRLCCAANVQTCVADDPTKAASSSSISCGSSVAKEQLSRKDAFELIESLYRDHPAPVWRVESRKAMEIQQHSPKTSKCLIYGEVSFIAFARMLELCVPLAMGDSSRKGFAFYDLGCGAGRPVFLAPMLRPDCVKSCGLEIIPSLSAFSLYAKVLMCCFVSSGMHEMNQELLLLYKLEVLPYLHPSRRDQDISFVRGDFLQEDWSDADIVFANATCFDDPLFEQLEQRATQTLRNGSVVISVTKRFSGGSWELVQRQEMKMSWAPAIVHVQRKKQQNPHSDKQTTDNHISAKSDTGSPDRNYKDHVSQTLITFTDHEAFEQQQ